MTLDMRPLTGKDLFPVLALLGKLDLKDDILGIVNSNAISNVDMEDENVLIRHGMEMFASLAQKVLEKIHIVEKDVNGLLASLTNKKVEDIENLELEAYADLIFCFFEKDELKSFFTFIVERYKKMQSTE